MLQAEIMVSTSGQTAACRRTYSSTFSGFSPSTIPIRCISVPLFGDRRGEFGDAHGLDRVPIPIDADAGLVGRQRMAILDAHMLAGQLIELRNVLDISTVL